MPAQVGRPTGAPVLQTSVSSAPGTYGAMSSPMMRVRVEAERSLRRKEFPGVRGQSPEIDGSRDVASDTRSDTASDIQISRVPRPVRSYQLCESPGVVEGRSTSDVRRSSPVVREDMSGTLADVRAGSNLRRGSPLPSDGPHRILEVAPAHVDFRGAAETGKRSTSASHRTGGSLQFQSQQPLRWHAPAFHGEVQAGLTGPSTASPSDSSIPRVKAVPIPSRSSMKEKSQGLNQAGSVHVSIPVARPQREVQSALLSEQPSAEAALMDKIFSSIDDVRFAMQHDIEHRKAQDEKTQLTQTMTEHQNVVAFGGGEIGNHESSPPSEAEKVLFEIKSLMANEMRAFAEALPAACGVLRDTAEKEINKMRTVSASMLNKLTEESLPAACHLLKGEAQKAMLELQSVAPNQNQSALHLQKLDISVTNTKKEITELKECIDGHSRRLSELDIEFAAFKVERGSLLEFQKSQGSRIEQKQQQKFVQLHNHPSGVAPDEQKQAKTLMSEFDSRLLSRVAAIENEVKNAFEGVAASTELAPSMQEKSKEDVSIWTSDLESRLMSPLLSRIGAVENEVKSALEGVAALTEIAPSMQEMRAACLKVQEVVVRADEVQEVRNMCQAQLAACKSELSEDIDTMRTGIGNLQKDIESETSTRESLAAQLAACRSTMRNGIGNLQKDIESETSTREALAAQLAACRSELSGYIDTMQFGIGNMQKDIELETSTRESLASRLESSIDAMTKDLSKLQRRTATLHHLIMHGPGSSQTSADVSTEVGH